MYTYMCVWYRHVLYALYNQDRICVTFMYDAYHIYIYSDMFLYIYNMYIIHTCIVTLMSMWIVFSWFEYIYIYVTYVYIYIYYGLYCNKYIHIYIICICMYIPTTCRRLWKNILWKRNSPRLDENIFLFVKFDSSPSRHGKLDEETSVQKAVECQLAHYRSW